MNKRVIFKSIVIIVIGLISFQHSQCLAYYGDDYDFKDGDFLYNILSEEEKTVEFYGIDYNWINYIDGTIDIPAYVQDKKNSKTYKVIKISQLAFSHYSGDSDDHESYPISVYLPETIEIIGRKAFYKNHITNDFKLPDSVRIIEESAFERCIADITLGNSIEFIGDNAFAYASNLKGDIILPETVRYIGNMAFYESHSLTSIRIPRNVSFIGGGTFAGCENLTEIEISPENKYLSMKDGVIYNKDLTECYCCAPWVTRIDLPETLTKIIDYSLSNSTIEEIILPESLREIGEWAFWYCIYLTDISIPDRVTDIRKGTFYYCKNLQSVKLPSSIRTIGDAAF